MNWKTLLAAAVAGVLSMAPMLAGKAVGAPDRAHGMAIMGAHVTIDGGLIDGAGAVSSEYIENLGAFYAVTFDRPVEGCVAQVTPISANRIGSSAVFDDGLVLVAFAATASSGPPTSAFYLIVFCPE